MGPEDGSRGQYLLPPELSGYLAGQQPKKADNRVNQKKIPGPKAKSVGQKTRSRASSSSVPIEAIQETQAMMMTLVETVKDLKGEVEALKEERPHKKKEISTASSA